MSTVVSRRRIDDWGTKCLVVVPYRLGSDQPSTLLERSNMTYELPVSPQYQIVMSPAVTVPGSPSTART
jgi:hypothetical protein